MRTILFLIIIPLIMSILGGKDWHESKSYVTTLFGWPRGNTFGIISDSLMYDRITFDSILNHQIAGFRSTLFGTELSPDARFGSYLTLNSDSTFERRYIDWKDYSMCVNVAGYWWVNGDTLRLIPAMEYGYNNTGNIMQLVTYNLKEEVNTFAMPQTFLIKTYGLEDITNYRPLGEFWDYFDPMVWMRKLGYLSFRGTHPQGVNPIYLLNSSRKYEPDSIKSAGYTERIRKLSDWKPQTIHYSLPDTLPQRSIDLFRAENRMTSFFNRKDGEQQIKATFLNLSPHNSMDMLYVTGEGRPDIHLSGKWRMSNDSIFVYPLLSYYKNPRTGVFDIVNINQSEPNSLFMKCFLIRENALVEADTCVIPDDEILEKIGFKDIDLKPAGAIYPSLTRSHYFKNPLYHLFFDYKKVLREYQP